VPHRGLGAGRAEGAGHVTGGEEGRRRRGVAVAVRGLDSGGVGEPAGRWVCATGGTGGLFHTNTSAHADDHADLSACAGGHTDAYRHARVNPSGGG